MNYPNERYFCVIVCNRENYRVENCQFEFIDKTASPHSQKPNTENMCNRNWSLVMHLFWHFFFS